MHPKLKVGDLVLVRSSYRGGGCRDSRVAKVGRKFYTLENGEQVQISTARDIDDGARLLGYGWTAWLSEAALLDSRERVVLIGRVRNALGGYTVSATTDQLRRIVAILDEHADETGVR
jgi:hypothetical protein